MSGRLGVLISGRGSNLQAILDAIAAGRLDATVALVISNRRDAAGLARAEAAGVPTLVLEHRSFANRQAFDAALVEALKAARVDLVCLAGFMRLLSRTFVDAFPNAVINVHPSLLPAFPGVDAQAQAWVHGVKVAGCTVHMVTEDLDAGPIIRQATVPVLDDDTAETLSARILGEEHRIYPQAIALVLAGGWRIEGRRFVRHAGASASPDAGISLSSAE